MDIAKGLNATMLLFAILCIAGAHSAYAIDWDSGDWFAPTPNVSLGLIYQQHATRKHLYKNGDKVSDNAVLTSDVTMLRFAYPITLAGYVVNPNFVLPFGKLETDGNLAALGEATGIGDLLLTAPIWIVNKPTQRIYLGISPYLILPIGSYDKYQALNLGENRFKTDLQVGAVYGIGKHFSLEATADAMWFGKNKEANAENAIKAQNPLYQFLGYFNWHYTPTTTFALGFSRTSGGMTSIDGIPQNDRIGTNKWILTGATFTNKRTQLMLSIGRDISVKNGLKEDIRFNFRLLLLFPKTRFP